MKRILKNTFNALLSRRCYIQINYSYDFAHGEHQKVLYTFSAYVETFNMTRMLRNIPIEHAKEIDDLLRAGQKLQKKVELRIGDEGAYETLIIPKWGVATLSEEISRNILY